MKTKDLVDAGKFTLVENEDTGERHWEGVTPESDTVVKFDVNEPLILKPRSWPAGTVVYAEVPKDQDVH